MTTALIADDEAPLLTYLQSLLKTTWPELTIIKTASNGQQALELIEHYQPDIAFLDIAMPALTGLEVAQQCQYKPHIVFVTAYDQYAIDAFEAQAIDYLLKPVEQKRLQQTVEKLKKQNNQNEQLQAVLSQLINKNKPPELLKWIKVQQGDEIVLVNVDDVDYFQSSDKYTSVFTKEKEYLIKTSLKNLEPQLNNAHFWRIHRSTIINVRSIDKINKTLSGQLLVSLKGRKRALAVSRAHLHLFK